METFDKDRNGVLNFDEFALVNQIYFFIYLKNYKKINLINRQLVKVIYKQEWILIFEL